MQKYLIFGGTGFIGSHLCKELMCQADSEIFLVSRNKLNNDHWLRHNPKFTKVNHLICDLGKSSQIRKILKHTFPDKIIFCAGENPSTETKTADLFVYNNIVNVANFLQCCLAYYKSLESENKRFFKILNVTTYEIFSKEKDTSSEIIKPKTIYSATKASAFHLFNAWKSTYKLPIINAVCANNYGNNQNFDKLIPLTINNLNLRNPILLFNHGQCMRSWIHVSDTAKALSVILEQASIGSCYKIGSNNYLSNQDLVNKIIAIYSKITHTEKEKLYNLISIADSTHQNAYNHSCGFESMKNDFNWKPLKSFNNSLATTIQWYLNNNKT
ncbi:MAG: NAD-dependent epimerase/dehydratase family protein [Marinicellaceae bacterium]